MKEQEDKKEIVEEHSTPDYLFNIGSIDKGGFSIVKCNNDTQRVRAITDKCDSVIYNSNDNIISFQDVYSYDRAISVFIRPESLQQILDAVNGIKKENKKEELPN